MVVIEVSLLLLRVERSCVRAIDSIYKVRAQIPSVPPSPALRLFISTCDSSWQDTRAQCVGTDGDTHPHTPAHAAEFLFRGPQRADALQGHRVPFLTAFSTVHSPRSLSFTIQELTHSIEFNAVIPVVGEIVSLVL